MAIKKFQQDPDEILDYSVDWRPWLADGDVISGVNVSLSEESMTDLVINEPLPQFTTTHTTVWISGGTVGETYTVSIRVTTNGGRTGDRSIDITIREK